MNLPYIPPQVEGEFPPTPELVILFLEAVARVTPAFRELREQIFPQCDFTRNYMPLDAIEQWWKHWRLDFDNGQLYERIQAWTLDVLRDWERDPAGRELLRVDQGWWEWQKDPKRRLSDDKPPAPVTLAQWNPYREEFETYAVRMRAGFEKFLQEQRQAGQRELDKYDARPYRKRERKRENLPPHSPLWDFEWLALSICEQLGDGKIASKCISVPPSPKRYPGVSRDVVKKARQALEKQLRISRNGETGK